MVNFDSMFSMQGMLFTLMLLGWFLKRIGVITDSGKSMLMDLVIDVTLPCSIVKSFQMEFSAEVVQSCLVILDQPFSLAVGAFYGMVIKIL